MAENEDWYASDWQPLATGVRCRGARMRIEHARLAKRLGINNPLLRGWEDDLSEHRANRLASSAGVLGRGR